MVNKYKNVKGFFGFYIFDEPSIHDGLICNMREATLTIRELPQILFHGLLLMPIQAWINSKKPLML